MNRRQKLALTWGKIHAEKLYPGFERLSSNSLARELDSQPWLCVYVHRADHAVPETDGMYGALEKARNAFWQSVFTGTDKEIFLRRHDHVIKFASYARADDRDYFTGLVPFDRGSSIVFFTGGQPVPASAEAKVPFPEKISKQALITMTNKLYRVVANTDRDLIPDRDAVYKNNPDCWRFNA
jgi:hypothetical protein